MAFFDKLNDFAKNIGDKTNDAIETGKLNSRINSEKTAAGEELKKIGEYYYQIYTAGDENGILPEEILPFFESAKAHYDAAAEAQEEINRIKAENEAAKPEPAPAPAAAPVAAEPAAAPEGVVCSACGAVNSAGVKFCRECGNKMEIPAPAPEPVEEAKRFCTACGTEVAAGVRFCPECGNRME